jgi:hypothetical protein
MRQEMSPVLLRLNFGGSPILEDRLCFTATQTGPPAFELRRISDSYESAAGLAEKWGAPVDDAVLHVSAFVATSAK